MVGGHDDDTRERPAPGDPGGAPVPTRALEAERAASRRPARRARPPSRPQSSPSRLRRPSAAAHPPSVLTTEHVDAASPASSVVRLPAHDRPGDASKRTGPRCTQRASRITVTSAIAALAMFAASAMPRTPARAPRSPPRRSRRPSHAGLRRDAGDHQRPASTATASRSAAARSSSARRPAARRCQRRERRLVRRRRPFAVPGPGPMSSGFGYRNAPCGACSSLHQGLDFNPAWARRSVPSPRARSGSPAPTSRTATR